MAIHTQESLSGFIASAPQLTFTERGDARFYAKIGQERYRKEPDGSFTQTETTFHDLVAFKKTAERAHAQLAKGDRFLAEGYTREYDRVDPEGKTATAEEFVAKRIGHDLVRTNYEVCRSQRVGPTQEREAPKVPPPASPIHRPAIASSPALEY